MAVALLFVLVFLYAFVAIKVDQWQTISILGFKSETPELFLRSPRAFHTVRILLFLCALAASYLAKGLAGYISFVALAATWLGAFWIGRKLAFNSYRKIYREMIEYDEQTKASDPAEYARMTEGEDPRVRRADLEAGTRISDTELIAKVEKNLKRGF